VGIAAGESVGESDLAIVAALVFAWGTLSARLERFDVTAPIIFVLAGVLLTHGPLATLSVTPAPELVKALAEVTLVLAAPRALRRGVSCLGCRR
jgi:sodium/hydrogen antiporter